MKKLNLTKFDKTFLIINAILIAFSLYSARYFYPTNITLEPNFIQQFIENYRDYVQHIRISGVIFLSIFLLYFIYILDKK